MKTLNVLELFSGTGTFSRIARERGHNTFMIDLHQPADLNADIASIYGSDILRATGWGRIDILWASPPCDGFSVASIGRHWRVAHRAHEPKSTTARLGIELLRRTIGIINELAPTVWFIENPRGMMRKMPELQELPRHTVTYCQYGEVRMKPTDIWTNSIAWTPRPACKNGAPCHERAPRGSRTGTQGINGKKARAALPEDLCVEVLAAAERDAA